MCIIPALSGKLMEVELKGPGIQEGITCTLMDRLPDFVTEYGLQLAVVLFDLYEDQLMPRIMNPKDDVHIYKGTEIALVD